MNEILVLPQFTLQSGTVLRDVPVAYRTWGRLNAARDNAIIVCHALTGNTNVADWWGGMMGPRCTLDPDHYFIVCANVIGSPYGTLSPLTVNPETGKSYGPDFPAVTIRDTVALHRALLGWLGVRQVAFAIGGSLGGMQVLEWAFYRRFVRALVPIAVGGQHSAWCIGWSEAQRQAIFADPCWQAGRYAADRPPRAGLAAARMMAMISYRTRASFEIRFGRTQPGDTPLFAMQSYLHHQGEKLVQRFDANCYVQLTRQMDTHDIAMGRGVYSDVVSHIQQPTLVVGIDSDVLYPLEEQRELASYLPNGTLSILSSPHGHDAFLIEFDQMNTLIQPWLDHTSVLTF